MACPLTGLDEQGGHGWEFPAPASAAQATSLYGAAQLSPPEDVGCQPRRQHRNDKTFRGVWPNSLKAKYRSSRFVFSGWRWHCWAPVSADGHHCCCLLQETAELGLLCHHMASLGAGQVAGLAPSLLCLLPETIQGRQGGQRPGKRHLPISSSCPVDGSVAQDGPGPLELSDDPTVLVKPHCE